MTNFSTPNPGDLIAVTDLTQVFDPINDLESGAAHWAGTTSGSANAYTASLTNTPGSLTAGLSVNLRIHASNTGASTLNLNGLGDVAIRSHNAALTGGELLINATYNLVYDGTYFQVVGSGSGGPVAIGDISDWPAGVSATELGYLDNASSNIQTQINGKADTSHTHPASDIDTGRLARARMPSDINSNLSANLVNGRIRKIRSLSLASGENDLGSPSSGKRWLVLGAHAINPTAGSITLTAKIKNDGIYWAGSSGNAISAGSVGLVLPSLVNLPVFDSTDTLSIHATASGAAVVVSVLEFDDSSSLKSAKLWSLSTGHNTLYTCPEGYSAVTVGLRASSTIPYALSPYETLIYRNDSGGTRTYSWALVDDGDTPDTPGAGANSLQGAAATLTTGNISNLGQAFHALQEGDSLTIHVDDGTGNQAAWTNLLEVLL